MSIYSGNWIRQQSNPENPKPMISPCRERNKLEQAGKMSYGVGPCGYDVVISSKKIQLVTRGGHKGLLAGNNKQVPVPEKQIETMPNQRKVLWVEPGQLILAEVDEKFNLPEHVAMVPYGKSSYTRQGLQINATIGEPGWSGTFGFSLTNPTNTAIAVFLDEGIMQMQFVAVEGEVTAYDGKYQNATKAEEIMTPEAHAFLLAATGMTEAVTPTPAVTDGSFLETEDSSKDEDSADTEKNDGGSDGSASLPNDSAKVSKAPAAKSPTGKHSHLPRKGR